MESKFRLKLLWCLLVVVQIFTIVHLKSSDPTIVESGKEPVPEIEPGEIKSESKVSILAVGDSYTYGAGLENQSEAWPAVLEKIMRNESRNNISVTPLARPGAGIEKYAEYLAEVSKNHDPEIVILQINSRDFIDREGFEKKLRNKASENITRAEEKKLAGRLKVDYVENATETFKRERFRKYFEKINNSLDGDEEVYVLNDYINNMNHHPNYVNLFTEKYGWKYYRWTDFYEEVAEPEEVWISESDHHYNAYGNRIWAEQLSSILLEESDYLRRDYDHIGEAHLTKKVKGSLPYIYRRNASVMLDIGVDGTSLPLWHVKTNSKSLRGPNFETKPDKDVTRILVIGDSYTFGWGLNYSEVYTARLENMLEENSEGEFQVINAGIYGTGIRYFHNFLKERGIEYNPDVVVIAFQKSDMFSVSNNSDFRSKVEATIPEDSKKREEKIKRKARELKQQIISRDIQETIIPKAMEKILETGREEDIPVVFYHIGHRRNPESLKDWAKYRNATFISAPEEMRESKARKLILKPEDVHYNSYTHRLLAEKLYSNLRKFKD